MQTNTPRYIHRNGLLGGLLLAPFFAALLANGLDKAINNHTLHNSWLWRSPVIGVWVLILPLLALSLGVISYLGYLFGRYNNDGFMKRALNVFYAWPVLVTSLLAFSIVCMVFFHDSTQCWVQTPQHLVTHVSQTWHCSTNNAVSIPKLFQNAI